MNRTNFLRAFMSNGFLRTVRGALPLSLTHSLAKECGLTVYGNTKKYTTIDGVRYAVPDDVTLVDSVTANEVGFYLNFGITPKLNTKARIVFTPLESNTTGYFGARKDVNSVRFSITTFNSGLQFTFALTQTTWSNNKTTLAVGTRYDCTAYNGKQIINGTEYNEIVLSDLGSTDATFKIGSINGSGGPAATVLNARYELVYIWEGDTPVLLALPAIRNNVVGYYDFVSKQFIAPTVGTLTAGKITRTENFHTDIPADLYEECEYITSSGEQYINTGVTLGIEDKIISVFSVVSLNSGDNFFYGCQNADSSKGGMWCEIYGSYKWYVRFASLSSVNVLSSTGTETVRTELYKNTFKINGETVLNPNNDGSIQSTPVTLFGRLSSDGSTFVGSNINQKEFVICDANSNARIHLVQVKRLSDNQYGMYDRVTSTFFPNAGTGAFTGGPARQIEVPICEYEFVGNRTENLFDKDSAVLGTINSTTGSVITGTVYRLTSDFIEVSEGEQLSFAGKGCKTTDPTMRNAQFIKAFYDASKEFVAGSRSSISVIPLVIPSGVRYVRFEMYFTGIVSGDTIDKDKTEVTIIKGSTAPTEYIPYGYDVPMRMGNQGVVDLGTLNYTRHVNINNNEYFRVSIDRKAEGNNYFAEYYRMASNWNNFLASDMVTYSSANMVYFKNSKYHDASAFKDAMSGLHLYYQRTTDEVWNPPTLRHLASSRKLGKIGSITDTASIKDGVRTSVFWIGHKIFDGTETFVSSGILDSCWVYDTRLDADTAFTDRTVLCDFYKSSAALPAGDARQGYVLLGKVNATSQGRQAGKYVGFGALTEFPTLAEWQAFLAKQYAAGHPVEIWYPLATAVTETATETNITLPENDVTLDAESTVKPTEADVTFNSRSNY